MKHLSITKKITIWYTVFMLVITVCMIGVLVYTGNLRAGEAAKTVLVDAVDDAGEDIEHFDGSFVTDDKLKFYEDGIYISIYDGNGELIEGRIPKELTNILSDLDDETITKLTDAEGTAWYIYDSLFEVDNRFVWVRGIVKGFAEQSTFHFVFMLVLVALPGLVLIAAFGGYAITKRGFRPVRDVISTVEEIKADGDISRRVPIKKEHSEAKDEIHKLASAFNEMFDKLEMSFEQEKQFTSDVSHELRTPLAVIISQSDYAMEDREYRAKALEIINREANRMSSLVNRLLTLSRSDSGRLKLEKNLVDMGEICRMVAEQQAVVSAEKNISIETDIASDVIVNGDEAMIIRIILNLVDNAVKYGKEGGDIRLSLEKGQAFAICRVEDNGIGIAEEDIDKIWERFYRTDSSRSQDGAGLGLSMVYSLVKAHGGRTEARSIPGEGSCFTVYLPIAGDRESDRKN